MASHEARPACPFCPFSVGPNDEEQMYTLIQHLELSHPENGQSPFIARDPSPRAQSPFIAHNSNSRAASRTSSRSRPGTARARSRSITPSEDGEDEVYVDCPAQCGESVHLTELANHMELHDIEGMAFEDARRINSRDPSPRAPASRSPLTRSPSRSGSRGNDTLTVPVPPKPRSQSPHGKQKEHYGFREFKELLLSPSSRRSRTTSSKANGGGVRRLGKAELGPHAYEEKMPAWLMSQLERGAAITVTNRLNSSGQIVRIERVANETQGIVPVLAQLCEQEPSISKAFLCHPGVTHVVKMHREGGFCGYRNIQMMVSFIQATRFPGYEHFPGRLPTILRLQDMIESAWDQGLNSSGRVETGGIRGTRKYIGTPEAQALFCSLDIGVEASAFNRKGDNTFVHDSVLESVLAYFSSGVRDPTQKVYQTRLAPIYFQHPGHSLTIIGLEVRKNGSMSLLVLDPMFKTAPGICRLIDAKFRTPAPDKLLKAYRRGDEYLKKYQSFEILKLTKPAQNYMEVPNRAYSSY